MSTMANAHSGLGYRTPNEFAAILKSSVLTIDLSVFIGNVSPRPVRRDGYAPAVRMFVALMRSTLAYEIEAIAGQRGDQLTGGKRTEATIIDGHFLDGDRNAGGPRGIAPLPRLCPQGLRVRACHPRRTLERSYERLSLMFFSASSLVRPDVAPPIPSSAGQ